jgi:TPP-dependent pyruvate/acetoin dehydrogenase alpha subunit
MGEGFYTIGPCGEELLSAVGLVLAPSDPVALHYRHLATQIARHSRELALDDPADTSNLVPLLLDRARGYVLSAKDPVTGGAHCALGGGAQDYLVTSTLASQSSPAVGRALAPGIMKHTLELPSTASSKGGAGLVSYASLGDGSVNNGHFLSAANLAAYASHRGFKCPVLFGISDNDLCISLKGVPGWIDNFSSRLGFRVFSCDGSSLADVFRATRAAVDTSKTTQVLTSSCLKTRKGNTPSLCWLFGWLVGWLPTAAARRTGRPAALLFRNLPRRFGHAATDRQTAYMTQQEVDALASSNPLEAACAAAVAEGIVDYPTLSAMFDGVGARTLAAFQEAATEPKLETLGVGNLVARNAPPLAEPSPSTSNTMLLPSSIPLEPTPKKTSGNRRDVLRKHMNRAIGESLETHQNMVYIGEDVEHGG